MDDQPIGYFDSGVGGLPYLAHAKERYPDERFAYVADTRNFPYGEKNAEEVRAAVLSSVSRLIDAAAPKIIVVACNTASVIALAELRSTFQVPFVGVVPAIKPAAQRAPRGHIGILATSRTVADAYTDQLIQMHAADCRITRVAGPEIVATVEHRLFDSDHDERLRILRPFVEQFKAAGVDAVVLGCTHFVHLAPEFRDALGDGIEVLDSREGVTRQLGRLLDEVGRRDTARRGVGTPARSCFYTTGGSGVGVTTNRPAIAAGVSPYERFARGFGLDFCGELPK